MSMPSYSSRSRVFTVLSTSDIGLSGARAIGDNVDGDDATAPGATWTVNYLGDPRWPDPDHSNEWDLANEGYFDSYDEMVVPADGIYFVVGETNEGYTDGAIGYFAIELTKNGEMVASYAQAGVNAITFGYIDMPTVRWVGAASKDDRFALRARNALDDVTPFGGYVNFLCVLRVA